MRIKNTFLIILLMGLGGIILAPSQLWAICPLCTIAVCAGAGFFGWLGIDDIITGLWIGGLTLSAIMWTMSFLNKKNIRFLGRRILLIFTYYSIIIAPLYWKGIIGHPFNKFWGIDRMVWGIILGSISFFAGVVCYIYLKEKNKGRSYFPLQKVVLPMAPLVILSLICYFFIKR